MKLKNLCTPKKYFVFVITLFLEVIFLNVNFYAQDIEAKITLLPSARVRVEGQFLNEKSNLASKQLSFLKNYADVKGLGARIENLKLFNAEGSLAETKNPAAGEFQTDDIPQSWQYEVNAPVSEKITDAAHVSWVSENLGFLMLADLLPEFRSDKPVSAKIIFQIPGNWQISSGETPTGKNAFNVKNVEKAVFLIGKNQREKTVRIGKTDLSLTIAGEWQFTDEEASEMAGSILREHEKVFGETPAPKAQIFLLPFPQDNPNSDRWRAETRGATVTIISGAIPFKSLALQRLHEQLRHEIFHFWIPNALNLSGNYDWFYEGFAVYQALRTGVELNQIRFEDFLNTLSRAYDLAQGGSVNRTFSLVAASQNRWAGADNFIYARGLIAAFLCDVALLRESKGKRSIRDIFRAAYQKHRAPAEFQDGSAAILSILKNYPELVLLTENYIEGTAEIKWRDYLESAGIETENGVSAPTKLKVKEILSGRQKDLLDKLGYNQWRKLLQKKK